MQRDPALSPTLALVLDERLHQLAGRLAKSREQAWGRGLARLLTDREALDKQLAERERAPRIPPGMPIGSATADWLGE